MEQQVRFCTAPDGVRIAYATHGSGPKRPIVRVATWLTHLDLDADLYECWLREFGDDRTYVRYDMRGCGLSDPDAADFSFEAKVGDLIAVVDAIGEDRVDLIGVSGGGCVAVAYAVRHPDRVAHLVLYGAYAQGRNRRPDSSAESRHEDGLLVGLTKIGWGRSNPAFRRLFTTLFMPDASPERILAYEEMQRLSCSPETAARIRASGYDTDVVSLARQTRVPTMVLHVRHDGVAPYAEGRRLAGLIPGAQFVTLEGRSHILAEEDPAWRVFVDHTLRFFASEASHLDPPHLSLTPRESAILALVAEGCENEEIADRLGVSTRTVERHLSNVYLKLGLRGRAARAAAAAAYVRRH